MNMDPERITSLNRHIEQGTLVRRKWRGRDSDGRELVCLLVALAPEVKQSSDQCPASVLPRWFASLVPLYDDHGSLAAWPAMVRRFAAVMARVHALTETDWHLLMYRCNAATLREGLPVAGATEEVVRNIIELCDRAGCGEAVTREEWHSAKTEAWAMRKCARWTERLVVEAAVATASKTVLSATLVAKSISRTRGWSPECAVDLITDAHLTLLESACLNRESRD